VTWRAVAVGDGSGHLRLERSDGTGERVDLIASLVPGAVFGYDTADPTAARVVTVTLRYDAVTGNYASPKRAVFEVRLRNAR
jgi:hypothetical protein